MRFLLDTHVLIWAGHAPERLSSKGRRILRSTENELFFSVVSLWEIGVKRALNRADFQFDPRIMRGELLTRGFIELPVSAEHVLAVNQLPRIHRDPFDRLLLCQTLVDGLTILTTDDAIMAYAIPALRV